MATLKIKNEQGIFEKVPFIIGGITQTDLDDIKKDFLPLTGGTLTGNITINNTYPVTEFIQEKNKVRLINDKNYFWIEGTSNNATEPTSRLSFNLSNGELFINNANSRVYHENYKPSALDIGAVPRDTNGYTHQPLYIDSIGNIGQVQLICGNYGFGIRNDGVDTYFMLTDPGDPYGSWNNLRPIVINNTTGRVEIAGNADCVDGVHFHPVNSAPLATNPTPYFYAFNGGDDYHCYVKNTSEISVKNSETVKGRDVCAEIDSLKQSVVSGKQAVVDAINNKLGYASGLTTSHSGADYAWWIENQIGPSPNNVIGCSITKSSVCSNSSSMPKAGVIHVYGSLNKNITVSVECISGEFIIIPEYSMVNGSKNSNPVAVKLSVGQKYTFGVYQYGTVIIFLKRSHIKYHTVLDSSNTTCDVNRLSIG